MSQYRTRSDLVTEALESLGVLAAGQTPELEDTARIDEKIDSILADLAGREIVYVADPDNIPQEWFNALADIVAYECRTKFGVTADFEATLERANTNAIEKLKVILRGRPTYEPQRSHYF